MKSVKCLFLIITAFAGCVGYSQKNNDVVKIEFTSLTRGYNKQIVISADTLSVSKNVGRGGETQTQKKKLDSKDLDRLSVAMDGITLSEVPDLKSPTAKREFDGARHSTITITTKAGVTVSHSFDDEMPHEKLQKLMKELSRLEKLIN